MKQEKPSGLDDAAVADKRRLFGSNVYENSNQNKWQLVLNVIREPMTLFLFVACGIYFITGQFNEGTVMLLAIFMVAGISVYQELRSDQAIRALHQLVNAASRVIRNEKEITISSEEIVVDDIVLIAEGEKVPADLEILEANDCSADESLLSGESFPVRKDSRDRYLYAGSLLTAGMATTRVIAVGSQTRLGKLGKSMEKIQKEKSPLQKQIAGFVRRMAVAGMIAFIFVWFYNFLLLQDVLKSLLQGLTLAMAILPEEIPVALTTFMALGAMRMIRFNVLTRHTQTVESLGSATVIGVDKTGTLTENKMKLISLVSINDLKEITEDNWNGKIALEILEYAFLASEPLAFDPMEIELHMQFHKFKDEKSSYHNMIHEYPLSGKYPVMTHIHEDEHGNKLIAVKGSVEGIIENSNLTAEQIAAVLKKTRELAGKGYRVLAVAKSNQIYSEWPLHQQEIKREVLGLIAFYDPPRPNMDKVIQGFYNAGIHVKLITGDFPETAVSIAEQINLKNPDNYLTGQAVMDMNQTNLMKELQTVNVYARMTPEAKLRVINVLKDSGEVVAMTGDGVNDGPALRSAHIGIAMGKRGTNVAKEAASLILLDDNLENMLSAIALGRKIYGNLKKAIRYIISIHIPLISIVTLPLILGWKFPNIFSPVHVIFLELVMGPTCSIVFENEPAEKNSMSQAPRKMAETFFTWRELSFSVFQGLMITAGLMLVMHLCIQAGRDESTTRTIVFFSLVVSNILLTLSGRSERDSIIRTLSYHNKRMPAIIFITLLFLIATLVLPPVRTVFQFAPLAVNELLLPALIAIAFVVWFDVYKIFRWRNKNLST